MEKFKFVNKISSLDKTRLYYPLLLLLFGSIVLSYKLGNIPKALSLSQLSIRNNLISHLYNYHYLLHHLLTFPFYSYLVILNYLNNHNLVLIGLVGYLCGILAIFLFYYIAETFTNKLIGALTTGLFGTSLWFLQITRNSQSLEYYSFAILLGIFIAILYYRKKSINLLVVLSSILLGLAFYIPCMILFSLLFIIINFKIIKYEIHALSIKYKSISISIFCLMLAPVVYESVLNHSLIYRILSLPRSINLHQILIQFIDYPKLLFVQNNPALGFSVGQLPLVNFASAIILIFAAIWLYKNHKNTLTAYIYLSLAVDWVLCALNGNQSIYIILPLLSLLVSIGIFYLYNEWKKIFPKNPYPDFTAKFLIVILVASIGLYQILLYFIVWPHTPQVLAIYSHYL